MIFWEEESLNDRERIFEFLYQHNPEAADKTDSLIEEKVEILADHPMLGAKRTGIQGRLLILPEISMLVSYHINGKDINVMRVLHQKQQFP